MSYIKIYFIFYVIFLLKQKSTNNTIYFLFLYENYNLIFLKDHPVCNCFYKLRTQTHVCSQFHIHLYILIYLLIYKKKKNVKKLTSNT